VISAPGKMTSSRTLIKLYSEELFLVSQFFQILGKFFASAIKEWRAFFVVFLQEHGIQRQRERELLFSDDEKTLKVGVTRVSESIQVSQELD
jgi:hypothetical protein